MHLRPWLMILIGSGSLPLARAQNDPRVGYLYPAGAARNTRVEILAGGQNLRTVDGVRISGGGVEARVIKSYRAVRNLDADQRALLQWRVARRRAQITGNPAPPEPPKPKPNPDGSPAPKVTLPEMPFLDLLDTMDLPDIEHWVTTAQRRDRMQPSPQLGEFVRIEVEVSASAKPGMRELRLIGPTGLTNPLRFEIGTMREVVEREPNEPGITAMSGEPPSADVPCVWNGQIQAGDVDLLRIHARRGQALVIRGEARALIPYLADAVPGWFQMVLAIRDSKGREISYADDFRFDPDPVMYWKVPEDGVYTLEVRDAIYRGREDFVYRISVGETPFVASIFPLGGTSGKPLVADVRGWNLPHKSIRPDCSSEGPPIRSTRVASKTGISNPLYYAVDPLPDMTEVEPDNDAASATRVVFPCVVNGRIDTPGDVDVFRIDGHKGMDLVVEVEARVLRSPLDAVIHVADESGRVLAWNDDLMEKDGTLHLGDGMLTHHADPRVKVKLPADGPAFIRIADTQRQGGPDHAYRIKIRAPSADFVLKVTPSAVNIPPGGNVPFTVHVLRADGFDGEISLQLENAPPGMKLSGGVIPRGAARTRLTLTVPQQHPGGVFSPQLAGTAEVDGVSIRRKALAADDTMQAFLWRHLVPADEWLVCVAQGRGRRPAVELAGTRPLRIPVGGSTEVRVKVPKWIVSRGLDLQTNDGPPGLTLSPIRKAADGFAFHVTADASAGSPGTRANLIVDVFADNPQSNNPQRARQPITCLPAIPIILDPPAAP